mgnify:CR=1 FL=1
MKERTGTKKTTLRRWELALLLGMAAAALTGTSVMASKVFRPVIRAGVAAAVILAALIAAVVTGKKIADRRRSPWEKFTGNLRRMRPVRKTKWSIRF